jgi:predicted MFS family arabinose efflux permease
LPGGAAGIVAPAAGLLLLDVAVQCGQVANQARIFALRPDARSRLNTGYMTCAFLGGSAGPWLGTRTYLQPGRAAVCALIALAALLALAAYLVSRGGRHSDGETRPRLADVSR